LAGIESTGSYHELLADLAHQRGFDVYVLNPKDILTEQAVSVRAHRDRCLAAIYPIKERDQALRVARQYLLFRIQRLTEFWCIRAIGRPASTSLGPDGDGWAAASTARTEQVNLAVMSAS
jgi:hypothetical protein